MARQTHKIITIGERKFRINKFDAFTGSYILYNLMEKMLPMMLESKANIGDSTLESNLPSNRKPMTRDEFKAFQLDCLRACQEVLPAGNSSVIDVNGNFGVLGLESDTAIVMRLTIEALVFNIASFFEEGSLDSILSAMSDIKLPNSSI